MKKIKKIIFLLFSLLGIWLVCMACEKDDGKTYYSIVGDGYVFDGDSMKPIAGVSVEVLTYFEDNWTVFGGYFVTETYTADSNGHYQIRFIKKERMQSAKRYSVGVYYDFPELGTIGGGSGLFVFVNDLKNAKGIFYMDTIKFYRSEY